MTEQIWRPLGVDTEEEMAAYDALHDGVPNWMKSAYWRWVKETLLVPPPASARGLAPRTGGGVAGAIMLDTRLLEQMCHHLRFDPRADLGHPSIHRHVDAVVSQLHAYSNPLAIADYLLAFCDRADEDELEDLLLNAGSGWTVGIRLGRSGLVRRVPEGVQEVADTVMTTAGRAGVRLAKAWGELYGIDPDPSAAYSLAIKAVEDAAIPVVSPNNGSATLGTVLGQIRQQGNWRLPMEREDDRAPSQEVLLGMLQVLWSGQHDRHGGQPSGPGDVSIAEATVAVSLAVTLVNLFHAGLVSRES